MKTSIFNFLFLLAILPIFAQEKNAFEFVENKNQWTENIRFRADIPNGYLFLKDNGLHYAFYDAHAVSEQKHHHQNTTTASRSDAQNADIEAFGVSVAFLNANLAQTVGKQKSELTRNYYLGKDKNRWASSVPSFYEIEYKNLYKSVDLRFYTETMNLKYEFIVYPNGKPDDIQLEYKGATAVMLHNETLVIKTTVMDFIEQKPYSYQIINGKKVEINSRFRLENNTVSFEIIDKYDKTLPLIIDPTIVFTTYSGSVSDNWGSTATYDSLGHLYAGGTAFGSNFPTTIGAFQVNYSLNIDVSLLKFSQDGTKLRYGTFLGGEQAEVVYSLIVNSLGQLAVLGSTSSTDFPTTLSAFDQTFNGGLRRDPNPTNTRNDIIGGVDYLNGSDIFISLFNENGSRLEASTYLGGSGDDGIGIIGDFLVKNYGDQFRGEIMTDTKNNIYITTVSRSATFPTKNAAQTTLRGLQDGVIAKFNPTLSNLAWSTFIGGTNLESAYSIKVANNGDVYVCGGTLSPDFPISNNALRTTFEGSSEGFVARYNADGQLQSTTFLGTSSYDQAYLLDLDTEGNVYVFGSTLGAYPVSAGVYHNAGSSQFIHKINPNLRQSFFSTVIGSGRGFPDISPTAFLVSDCGNIYLAGWGGITNNANLGYLGNSNTEGMPVTADALRGFTDGDDFYLMLLSKDAQRLVHGTFFGGANSAQIGSAGDHVDGGTSRFDKKGVIYHTVCSCRTNVIPTTPNAFAAKNGTPFFSGTAQLCNIAAFKVELGTLNVDIEASAKRGCAPFTVTFANNTRNGTKFLWNLGENKTSTSADNQIVTFSKSGMYVVRLDVESDFLCQKGSDTDTIFVFPDFVGAAKIDNSRVCAGEPVQLQASGGVRYVWSPATDLDNANIANPIARPRQTTRYQVRITNENGCTYDTALVVNAFDLVVDFEVETSVECGKPAEIRLKNKTKGATNFKWSFGNGESSSLENPPAFSYQKSGKYAITLEANNSSCSRKTTINIDADNILPPNVITPNGDGKNDYFVLNNSRSGWKLEIYNRWGKNVFKSDNYMGEWNGENSSAVYYYLLTSPEGKTCKGWVQVLK